jgi:thiol-disulfide isomerase/thioredoxin
MKTKISILFFFLAIFISPNLFAHKDQFVLKTGNWRGVLIRPDSVEIPFTFEIQQSNQGEWARTTLVIRNAEERITAEVLTLTKDSINWRMPVFDSWFKCKIENDSLFTGVWYNRAASKPYDLKFRAEYGRDRIPYDENLGQEPFFIQTKYKTVFSPGTPDSSMAITLINYKDGVIGATVLTETGDYRYLEGGFLGTYGCSFSCFDGSHAFLFSMNSEPNGQWMTGTFYSGAKWQEAVSLTDDYSFELRNPESLTWITDSSNVNFTFMDLNGNPVSLSDPKYKNKVVIIQVMGSWCPNCMDETAWLSEVYKKYNAQGLEIIALAYERSPDTAKSNSNIRRVRDRFDADYTFLNTQKTGKDAASASLPFLNGIMSFPTTIYIDRNGNVRMVYTGFNGPATGTYYEKDTERSLRLIQELLAEKGKK